MKPIRAILHPTDFSPQSEYAYRVASALARDFGARLIAVTAVPREQPDIRKTTPPELEPPPAAIPEVRKYREDMEARLRDLPPPGYRATLERVLKEGPADEVILQTAAESNCDVIVMGSHARRGEAKFMFGSVADDVGRQAACPVLVVKLPGTSG